MGLFETLKSFFLRVWDSLKKIWTRIVNFLRDITNWFTARYNEVINRYPRADAVLLKIEETIQSRDYNTYDIGMKIQGNFNSGAYSTKNVGLKRGLVKTFYDHATGKILEDQTEIIEYDQLDAETRNSFGNEEMLVLD